MTREPASRSARHLLEADDAEKQAHAPTRRAGGLTLAPKWRVATNRGRAVPMGFSSRVKSGSDASPHLAVARYLSPFGVAH